MNGHAKTFAAAGCWLMLIATSVTAADVVPESSVRDLPVREITVFKDGHAFVLHEGSVPTHDGKVRLAFLPNPVIGTFWPYSADSKVRLVSARAGVEELKTQRHATELADLLRANPGARVSVQEIDRNYEARIAALPELESETQEAQSGAVSGSIAMFETQTGLRVVKLERLLDVTFIDAPQRKIADKKNQNVMTLQLDWGQQTAQDSAQIGMTYLQKGIRWVPNYRMTLDDDGQATLELQATLINEMLDFEDVKLHLVIGVPSFDFKETSDPFGLQQQAAELSRYFQQPAQTAHAFSNSIMLQTQVARRNEFRGAGTAGSQGAEIPGSTANEELFIFTVDGISMRKGERMVVPVGRWTVAAEERFQLVLPSRPPREIHAHFNTDQQAQLAKLYHQPKVNRMVLATNSSDAPFTTAPTLFVANNRLLGQGMMTYTPIGAQVEVKVNAAIDISVTHEETELSRSPSVRKWGGYDYDQIDLQGQIGLTNRRDQPVQVRVVREVMGLIDEANQEGRIVRRGLQEQSDYARPFWWTWYSWPAWWHQLNVHTDVSWNLTIEPGKQVDLSYDWHYFWQH